MRAQLVWTDPVFVSENDTVTVWFNAEEGSGGLANYNGSVYAHTGVITNLSTGASDWKYVKSDWGVNIPATLLTKVSGNIYKLELGSSIRDYYGVPSGEEILKMAFVFRSGSPVGGSYLEGKTATFSDIFIDLFGPGLQIKLWKPGSGSIIVDAGDTLDLRLDAQDADSLFLYENDVLLTSGTGNMIDYTLVAGGQGNSVIRGLVKDNTTSLVDSFSYFIRGPVITEALPQGVEPGVNVVSQDSVILVLYAPMIDYVFAMGDFSDWKLKSEYYMKRSPDNSYFWIGIGGLDPDEEYIYQYLAEGDIRIGDPYAEKVSDPWNDSYITEATYPGMLDYPSGKTDGIATVFKINEDEYQWQTQNFTPPDPDKLVVYELLIRDFTEDHSFQAVIDSIDYFRRLGINAIELMPVNEFEGNSSWGYNPNYYFAVDKYYGTKNDLKKLIDTLHQNGIAVILDVVYNHTFGTGPYVRLYWNSSKNQPAAYSPFYNMVAKHDFNVGFDMNHESDAVKYMVNRALKFWLEEFKVDGYRFDLSKGFTQKNTLGNVAAWGAYDADRIEILNDYADTIWSVNPDAYVILEHFADNNEETELASRGMMLWGNHNHNFTEAAMGYNNGSKSDFSGLSWQNRGWSAPRLIGYAESHDEERMMYKNLEYGNASGDYDTKEVETALDRMKLSALFLLGMPGPKMMWMFGELGYDYSIDFNGRTGEKPVRWDYYDEPGRKQLYQFYGAMNHLRATEEVFHTSDYDIAVSSEVKHMILRHSSMNAVIVGNFDVEEAAVSLTFPGTGNWYDYFTGDSVSISSTEVDLELLPGAYHLFTDKKLALPEGIDPGTPVLPDFDEGMLYAWPNPSLGDITLYIELEKDQEESVLIQFFTTSGQVVREFEVEVDERAQFTLSEYGINLRSGIYFCRITAGDQSETERIIVR